MKKARYICFEGTEGVGKTTHTKKLVEFLVAQGYKVLQTKEPGTPLAPLTMTLRGIMLDNQYEPQMTKVARELISQAIRSIHMEKVILPALYEYDFIVQDRGVLSGLAYGTACGNSPYWLQSLANVVMPIDDYAHDQISYDSIIYLRGDTAVGLNKALESKKEFASGDAMESKGNVFLQQVSQNMDHMSKDFRTWVIHIDGKSIDEVFDAILLTLDMKE